MERPSDDGEDMIRDRKYKKGEVIYNQGDKAGEIYFVKFGTVHLYLDYKTKDSKLIGFVSEGKVFGELGILEDKPRTVTSVAGEDCVVTLVDKESFPQYIKDNPNKLILIMESLSGRIIAQSKKLARACKVASDYAEEKEKNGCVSKELRDKLYSLAMENRKPRG